jgi:mono/diheme cytochrome c family protein
MPGNRSFALTVSGLLAVAGAVVAAAQPAAGRPPADPGKAAYSRAQCDFCHGPTGKGAMGPGLVPFTKSATYFRIVVRRGIGLMPPHPATFLSDADLMRIFRYLRKRPAR